MLSPDGNTLYVADANGTQLVAIDTATLTVTRTYPLPAGSCPVEVASVGSKLWFASDCDGQFGVIGSVPVAGGTATMWPSIGSTYSPYLRAIPGDASSLLVAARGQSPAAIERLDVSGTPTIKASVPFATIGSNLQDMAVTPDGKDVVIACGSPYYHQVLRTSDLSPDGVYPSSNYPSAVATTAAGGGLVAAGLVSSSGPSLYVYALGGTSPLATVSPGDVSPGGLTWAPTGDRLYVIGGTSGQSHVLTILTDPAHLGTLLTARASAPMSPTGSAVTISGQLRYDGAAASGQILHVTRSQPSGTAPLSDVATDASGSYSFSDVPTETGPVTYIVSWPGDGVHAARQASASSTVVVPVAPGVPLSVTATAGPGTVRVDFQPPASDGYSPILSYDVYRGTSASALSLYQSGVPANTPAIDSSPIIGLRSYYAVAAVNSVGTGAPSPPASAVPWSATYAGTFDAATRPVRLLDTRNGIGAPLAPLGSIGAAGVFHLQVTGRGDQASAGVVPAGASAVVVNVTAVEPTAATYLSLFPTGQPRPATSSLNAPAGSTVANLVTVPVGASGRIDVFNASGHTHVLVDLVGYYSDTQLATNSPQGAFHPQTPQRIVDTRQSGGPLAGGAVGQVTLAFDPATHGTLTGLLVTVTAVAPTRSGYLTVWSGGAKPAVSTLNFAANQTVSNASVLRPTSDGLGNDQFLVANGSAGQTGVVIDVVGWYDDLSVGGGLRFHPLTPTRIVDSRLHLGAAAIGPAATVQLGVPVSLGTTRTAALVTNVTAIAPTAATYLTLWPSGPTPPASSLDAAAGVATAGMVTTALSTARGFALFNASGSTDIAVDVTGYFDGTLTLGSAVVSAAAMVPTARPAPVPGSGG